MIRRLQIKFIAVTMGILLVFFLVVIGALNVYMQVNNTRQTNLMLSMIAEQDGILFPILPTPPGDSASPRAAAPPEHDVMRIFHARVDTTGELMDLYAGRMVDLTDDEVADLVDTVLTRGKARGAIDGLQYLVAEKPYGKIVVFAEKRVEFNFLKELLYISTLTLGIACAVLFLPVILLSRWAVRPVKTAFERQHQFISDASHELKTPLTIIAANADVLENEIGENRWLRSIMTQSGRMSALVHDLLSLASTEERDNTQLYTVFNLSRAVLNASLEFESRVFEEGKHFEEDIQPDIQLHGNEQEIRQLTSILVDNAIKHSDAHGNIRVTLTRQGGDTVLSVYNTGQGVRKEEREKLFERFYRSDASRARESGGYGLGLAIAAAIVRAHKGRITVEGEYGQWICFVVTF